MVKMHLGLLLLLLFNALIVNGFFRGVNLHGGWQGIEGGSPSVFGPPATLDYFKQKGLNTFRVGFAWQQLQKTLYGSLDAGYLGMMDTFIANCKSRGQYVSFVPLPATYFGNTVGSSAVPVAAFYDMWAKLGAYYANESTVWAYDLLNEPGMGDIWNTQYAPSTIDAIRKVAPKKTIVMPTSTGGWGEYYTSHLSGLPVSDPNVVYQAHFYFDTPADGTYPNGYDAYSLDIGVDRARGFINWCVINNVKCYAGEYGIPGGWAAGNATCTWGPNTNDPRWNTILDNFLTSIDGYDISGTYWDGGPYSDITDIGPTCNGADRPQMAVLTKHLGTQTPYEWLSTKIPPPKPATNLILYDGKVRSGFQEDGWGTRDLTNTNPVLPGCNYSISVHLTSWAAVRFQTNAAFSTTLYESISFYFYATSLAQQIRTQVTHQGPQGSVSIGNQVETPITKINQWVNVVIPFTDFNIASGQLLDGFWTQENNSTDQGMIYYDLFVINAKPIGRSIRRNAIKIVG